MCLVFFTRKYNDHAKNLIINNSENSRNAFPIVSAAKEIATIIAIELQVVDPSTLTGKGSFSDYSEYFDALTNYPKI